MPKYNKPDKMIHRGFYYLDDEIFINSLSAVEAGKVDEVVSKVNSAREGEFGGGVGLYGAKVEGSKKASSAFEESIVRTACQPPARSAKRP
jgi:GTP cyclohydrolase III